MAALWQLPEAGANRVPMLRALPPAVLAAATAALLTAAASPGQAKDRGWPPPVPGGLIGTLDQGRYTCEMPGVAGGPVRIAAKEFDFTVVRGSSYRAGGQRGSYLLTGDQVTMTGGALKGLKLHQISRGFLRRVEADGSDGEMRCVLATAGNT